MLRPRRDLGVFGFTAALVTIAGAALGLLWTAVAPEISIHAAALGSEGAYRALIGDDAWFLLLGACAGIATALLAWLLGARGPGAAAGLLVGGVLGALVAARVGFLAQRGSTLAGLRAVGLPPHRDLLDLFDFKIRLVAVLFAWPVAALVMHMLLLLVAVPPDRDPDDRG
jgi:hypothetical protein